MPSPLLPHSPCSSTSPSSRDRDKGAVNVQVLLRCRPFNEEELRSKSQQVIFFNEQRREVTVTLNATTKQVDRSFTFDKVFGPQVQQKDLYKQAIAPVVNEVLEGYSCTVFAYGQTGTGKTYTMEGTGKNTMSCELPSESGVIPRAVEQIFETLASQNADYSMKVTFLELYNEELTDLLARSPDNESQRKPLALMEDGKGGVLIRGLEEEVVHTASDVYTILEQGSTKRQTAETLLNKQSSYDFPPFWMIYCPVFFLGKIESTLDGNELVKCGKLNLVDLAGSENISRSGVKESRAREVGELNKSLLTLGRVITALVDHFGHVPYRDSKLTRLLRDSLGGKTKTCIIATISPSAHCLEETLSTLDYAHRAKSIKNRPEVNQKIMKSALIKDLYLEIDRLKTELIAAREKNGIYLPKERHIKEEAEKKAMTEKLENMEFELESREKKLEEARESLSFEHQKCADLAAMLEETQRNLIQTQGSLAEAHGVIKETQYSINERDYIISQFQKSESNQIQQAKRLESELEKACSEITELHLKIEQKNKMELKNSTLVQKFHGVLSQHLTSLQRTVSSSVNEQKQHAHQIEEQLRSLLSTKQEATEGLKNRVLSLKDLFHSGLKDLNESVCMEEESAVSVFKKLHSIVSAHVLSLEELLSAAVSEAESVLDTLQQTLNNQGSEIDAFCHQQKKVTQENIESIRGISKIILDFFGTLESSTTALQNSVSESNSIQQQSLEEFTRIFEECSQSEEKQLLESIAELLAVSSARKLNLVHTRVNNLRTSSEKYHSSLRNDMLSMQNTATDVQQKWQFNMDLSEQSYSENIASVSSKQIQLQELLDQVLKGAVTTGVNWKQAQEALQILDKNKVLEVDSIVKEGMQKSGLHLDNFAQKYASIEMDVDKVNESLLESIQGSLALDQEAGEQLMTITSTQCSMLQELQSCYEESSQQIHHNADQCFLNHYQEDKSTSTTPRTRALGVATLLWMATDVEHLQEEFRIANPYSRSSHNDDNGEENGNITLPSTRKETPTKPIDLPPLTTINAI